MTLPSPRLTNAALFILSCISMAFALYLQHYQHLEPCPLCIFQRFAVIGIGVTALVAMIHNPAILGRRIYAALTLVAVAWGLAVAGRHVWLQHLPADEVPACGPGLDYWMDTFPLQEVIQKVFRGSGECAKVDWTFLGFSLPEWTLVMFVGYACLAIWQLVRKD